MLEASAVVRLVSAETVADVLERQVADGELAAAVLVPQGYSDGWLSGSEPALEVVTDPANSAGISAQSEISAIAFRLASAVRAARLAADLAGGEENGRLVFDGALEQALAAWQAPPITVEVHRASAAAEESGEINAFAQSLPGMMAQFSVAGLMGMVSILVLDRKNRTMRRLLTTNMPRPLILFGHWLAMFLIITTQLIILSLFGQLFLQLDFFSSPLATLLVTLGAALFSASLGLLIGALARSEEQVIVFSLIPMFVLAGIGGAWVPLEIMPAGFRAFAEITPLAWIVTGYQDVIVRGLGPQAVWPSAVALAAYAVACLLLAGWRFKYE
jgi:ABC-2 type transport system permease protein